MFGLFKKKSQKEKLRTQYENLLKEFIERGYDLYLNTPRDKPNSESIILKKGILD